MINKIGIDDYSDEEVKAEYDKRILNRHIKWYEIFKEFDDNKSSNFMPYGELREFYGFNDPVQFKFGTDDINVIKVFENICKKAKEKGLV
jgi:hypothetical protein